MKRTILASCILLSGCYVDPNTGYLYPAQQYQQQVLVYHYQVPPPNPYYQARQEQPYYHQEWRQSAEEQYNQCVARDQERRMYQQPLEDCGAYFR